MLIHGPVLRGDSVVATQQPDNRHRQPVISEPIVEPLDETESLSLIAGGGVGRIGYTSRFGPAVLPANYDPGGGASWSRARRTSWTPRANSPRSPGSVWRRGRTAPRSSSSASSPGASPAGASAGAQRQAPPTNPGGPRREPALA